MFKSFKSKESSSSFTLDYGALNQPGEVHPSVHATVTVRERRSRENRLHNRRLHRRSQTKPNNPTSSKETIQLLHSISGEMNSASNIISHPDRCCYSSEKHFAVWKFRLEFKWRFGHFHKCLMKGSVDLEKCTQ